MPTPFIESQVQAEQLHKRIGLLEQENEMLRTMASPSAGPIELQAENILLEREARALRELVPHLTPYDGPLPETFEGFAALPDPHRRQVQAEHPDHVASLRQVDELLHQAAEHDRNEAARVAALDGVPVRTPEQFAALDDADRRGLAMTMTGAQRHALYGSPADDLDEAYL